MKFCLLLASLSTVLGFQITSQSQLTHVRACDHLVAALTVLDVEETAQRDIGTMEEWATAYGVQRCEGFQMTATNNENEPLDVGVMTTVDLPAESPVVFVPNEIILSANRAMEEIGCIDAAENLFAKLGASDQIPQFYLFLKILIEYEMGPESFYYPWLNSLPRYFSTGASMTHFCCSDCLPPLVGNLALKERSRFRQFFKSLDFCDFLSNDTKSYKKLAKWVFNIVHTRSFPDGYGDVKIAPLADYVRIESHTSILNANCFYRVLTPDILFIVFFAVQP